MSAVDMMNDIAHLRRPRRVEDGRGGYTTELLPVAGGPWWVQVSQPTAQERTVADADGNNIDGALHFQPGCPVKAGDFVDVVGDEDGHWEAVAVVEPSRKAYVRADCLRRQTEGEGA